MTETHEPVHLTPKRVNRWAEIKTALFSRIFKVSLVVMLVGSLMVTFIPKAAETVSQSLEGLTEISRSFSQKVNHWFVPKFSPEQAYFQGTRHTSEAELRTYLAAISDDILENDTSPSLADLQQHLLTHPWVVDARLSRIHHRGLHIHITEQVPVAVYADQSGNLMLVNTMGERFTAIDLAELPTFASLLRITGFLTPEYLAQLITARNAVSEAFVDLVRADRLQFAGWKLWYRRKQDNSLYYVYIRSRNTEDFLQSLRQMLQVEQQYNLSNKAIAGYDLRALPHLRIEKHPQEPTISAEDVI